MTSSCSSNTRTLRAVATAVLATGTLTVFIHPTWAIDAGGSYSSANAEAPQLTQARAFIAGGNYAGARAVLEAIVAVDPTDADAYALLGFAARKGGDRDSAFGFYQRAIALEPGHLGAHEYLGELFVDTGELEAARRQLAIVASLCGTECEAYRDLRSAIGDD